MPVDALQTSAQHSLAALWYYLSHKHYCNKDTKRSLYAVQLSTSYLLFAEGVAALKAAADTCDAATAFARNDIAHALTEWWTQPAVNAAPWLTCTFTFRAQPLSRCNAICIATAKVTMQPSQCCIPHAHQPSHAFLCASVDCNLLLKLHIAHSTCDFNVMTQ